MAKDKGKIIYSFIQSFVVLQDCLLLIRPLSEGGLCFSLLYKILYSKIRTTVAPVIQASGEERDEYSLNTLTLTVCIVNVFCAL